MDSIPQASWFKEVTESVPWFPTAFCIVLIGVLCIVGLIIIIRSFKGDDVSILWCIKVSPNATLKKLQAEFDTLNEDSYQKTKVIKLLHQMSQEIPTLIQHSDPDDFSQYRKHIYDYLLPGIMAIITKNKDNNHRVAIFIEENNRLKIHEGIGFSPSGKVNLRLNIPDSAAGNTYQSGEIFYSNNLNDGTSGFKKNDKSSTTYSSLICVPITYGNMILGVLSIDGRKESSFTKDDVDYTKYFAAAISPLLYVDLQLMGKFYVERGEEFGSDEEERIS